MGSGHHDPNHEGPGPFDTHRSEKRSARNRWLGRAARVLVILGALLIILTLFTDVLAGLFRRPGASPPAVQRIPATVRQVIDAVTVDVEMDGRPARVRYLGVEPPDHSTDLFDLASAVNRSWVQGVRVLLERDVTDADAEGRLLRYVWVDDAMVNAALLAYGLARHVASPPDTRYAADFSRIEAQARAEGRGIWQADGGDLAHGGAAGWLPPGLSPLSRRARITGRKAAASRSGDRPEAYPLWKAVRST